MKMVIRVAALTLVASFAGEGRAADDPAQNKALVRGWYEKLNSGDRKGALEGLAEDARNFGRPVGRRGFGIVLEDIFTTFPDWHMEIESMVAEGDSAAVTCRVTGTHRGKGKLPINGGMLVGVEPTQKRFGVYHIHWFKLRAGKIVDHWATRDDLGMMQQLGLLSKTKDPAAKR